MSLRWQRRGAYGVLVGKPKGKKPLRPGRTPTLNMWSCLYTWYRNLFCSIFTHIMPRYLSVFWKLEKALWQKFSNERKTHIMLLMIYSEWKIICVCFCVRACIAVLKFKWWFNLLVSWFGLVWFGLVFRWVWFLVGFGIFFIKRPLWKYCWKKRSIMYVEGSQ